MNQYDVSGLLITYSENILWSKKYYIIFKCDIKSTKLGGTKEWGVVIKGYLFKLQIRL